MSTTRDEGEELTAFASLFGKRNSIAASGVATRRASERKANQTDRERAAKRPQVKTEQVNFRASPTLKHMLGVLATKANCSVSDLIEKLCRDEAERTQTTWEDAR